MNELIGPHEIGVGVSIVASIVGAVLVVHAVIALWTERHHE